MVKIYTAEKREEKVFTVGANRLFRNIASTITGTSAIGALSTVIIGAIYVVLIVIGGRAIIAGGMTIGDMFMYVFFVVLVAFPVVQMASIGTQFTEAFAGLDRIREIMQTSTEDENDAEHERVKELHGEVAFDDVTFEYREDPGAEEHLVHRPGGDDDGAGGLERLWQEHADFADHGVCAPAQRACAGGRQGPPRPAAARLPLQPRRGAAGQLPVRRHGARQHRLLQARGDQGRGAGGGAGGALRRVRVAVPRRLRHGGRRARREAVRRAAAARGHRPRHPQRPARADARRGDVEPRQRGEQQIKQGLRALRTGRTTFVIAHRLSTIQSADQILVLEHGEIVERGTHSELLRLDGRYKQLYDTQYQLEHDQFINPGEEIARRA